MTTTVMMRGQARTLSPRLAKMLELLCRIEDRIESSPTCEVHLKRSAGGKVALSFVEHQSWEVPE